MMSQEWTIQVELKQSYLQSYSMIIPVLHYHIKKILSYYAKSLV